MRKIPHLRWWIIGWLFLSTVLNYLDRQTLSILARTIQDDLGMSDLDYSNVIQLFLVAYTLAYLVSGRLTDWIGARASMAGFIIWWSLANILTAFSHSAFSLGAFRFLLGLGEPGNYSAALKASTEWFPPKERGLAIGIYSTGSIVGATIAPPLIAFLATGYGWRSTFVFTGLLGLLWVIPWLWLYRAPSEHPRITDKELALVEAHAPKADDTPAPASEWQRWKTLLQRKDTWLLVAGRFLTDPVWYFYLFWFPKYLTDARQQSLLEVGAVIWVVYLAADIGGILGGWSSGWLIKRGQTPVAARKRILIAAACLVPFSPLVAFAPSLWAALIFASIVTFAHLAWLVTITALVTDVFPPKSVATVFGVIAAGSGLGGLLSTRVVGQLVTDYSYTPVFMLMGLLHPLALMFVWRVGKPGTMSPM